MEVSREKSLCSSKTLTLESTSAFWHKTYLKWDNSSNSLNLDSHLSQTKFQNIIFLNERNKWKKLNKWTSLLFSSVYADFQLIIAIFMKVKLRLLLHHSVIFPDCCILTQTLNVEILILPFWAIKQKRWQSTIYTWKQTRILKVNVCGSISLLPILTKDRRLGLTSRITREQYII